jgi:hypothetical protein
MKAYSKLASALPLLILIGNQAHARFEKYESLPGSERPSGYSQARPAAVHLGMGDSGSEQENSCGGTWISNQGHLLTALHCLLDYGTRTSIVDSAGSVVRSVDPRQASHSFSIVINGDSNASTATMLAYGHGYLEKDLMIEASSKDPAAYARNVAQGYGASEDWVILKVGYDHTSCVPAAPQVSVGDALWSIQFPHSTQRRDGYDVANDSFLTPYVTLGAVTGGTADNSVVQEILGGISDPDERSRVAAADVTLLDRPEILPSTLDAVPGSSGSGMLTDDGQLAGMVNSVVQSKNDDFFRHIYPGATLGVRLSHIQSAVSERFGASAEAQAFNCQ